MLAIIVRDLARIGIVDDALGARQRDEARPLARPISVNPALRARSTPHAVKPEREIKIGMRIWTVLMTISLVSRPVV